MTSTLQNILIVVGIILTAGVGWYMYSENSRMSLDVRSAGEVQAEIQSFIQTQNTLRRIDIDTSILNDSNFQSLEVITDPVLPQSRGRENPFESAL